MELIILLIHAFSTLAMVGLIWFVQVVHYPLFAHVSDHRFEGYHHQHVRLTGRVVGPPMIIETVSGIGLLAVREALPLPLVLGSFLLLGVVWASTMFLQIPRHDALSTGMSLRDHRMLVASNWIRTAAWSARGVLVMYMLYTVAG